MKATKIIFRKAERGRVYKTCKCYWDEEEGKLPISLYKPFIARYPAIASFFLSKEEFIFFLK